MIDRAADNATDSRAAYGADRGPLLSCGERFTARDDTERHHSDYEADETSHDNLRQHFDNKKGNICADVRRR